ncbi:MAG: VCBS repeat-containing protein, partial [Bacteroidetes bacterium]|nr:VCBS repeat-containing protein [Bacteroidota bacterium]
ANGSATWGDFDNDGDLDILVTGQKKDTYTPRTSAVYRNDSGEFTDIGAGLEPNSGKSLWGDYDNDGDLDILTSGDEHNGAKTRVYKNDAGTFTDIQADFIAIKDGTIEWLDYDNDGDLDIFETGGKAIGYNSDTSITVMYKNVAGTFTVDNTLAFANVKYATTTWGDFDDDGDLDLVMYGLVTPTTNYARMHMLYRNDSTNPNTAPTVPTNLSANATGNSVVLSWNASTDTETTDGRGLTYNIYMGTTSGGVDAVSPMADVSTGFRKVVATGNVDHNLSWSFEGLKNGTHYWSVQAIDPGFKGSAFAAEGSFASVDDAPAVPLEFTAKSGNSSVLLSWKPNTETDLNFYQIFRNSEDNSGTAAIIDTAMATDSTYEDKGLVIGQTYYYWLNASDNNGNESGLTSTASAVPKDFEPPAKPIGLLAYPSGKGVGLIWNANDEDDLAHYAIYRSKTSFELDADSIGIATSDTTYQDDSAEVDSLYFYRVSAVDVNGNKSSLSDAAEAVPAVLGRSLSLDGDGDYVDFGTANSDIFYGTFTQEAWIKTSSSSRCEIIGWSTPYDDFVVEFRMQGGKLEFGIFKDGNFKSITGNKYINNGKWTHVAVVQDGYGIKLYVNGILDVTGAYIQGGFVYTLSIGTLKQKGEIKDVYYFDGEIDELRVWKKARTQEEIVKNMKKQLRGDEDGLLALWHMNEPPGSTTIFDATRNKRDGSLKGDATFVNSEALVVSFGNLSAVALDGQAELNWDVSNNYNTISTLLFSSFSDDVATATYVDSYQGLPPYSVNVTNFDSVQYYWAKEVRNIDGAEDTTAFSNSVLIVPFKGMGNVVELDGTGDYISFDSAPKYPEKDLTFEAWIKTTSAEKENEILGWGKTNGGNVAEFRTEEGKLQFGHDRGGWTSVQSTTLVNTGEWVHVAVVKSGSAAILYVNGVEDASGLVYNTPDVDRICIGSLYKQGSFRNGYEFPGMIDELRIWNVARTESEINSAMKKQLRGDEPGLIALFHMDGPAGGTKCYNAVNNGVEGTAVGDAKFVNSDLQFNLAPQAFDLIGPANSSTTDSLKVTFKWNAAIDPNSDPIEYALNIFGTNVDTSITALSDTLYVFDGRDVFDFDTQYSWFVEATDGVVSTVSDTASFTTPTEAALNNAPKSFKLLSPTASIVTDSLKIEFVWEKAVDVDPGDIVLYTFNLFGTGFDSTIVGLSDTTYLFNGKDILEYDTEYSWFVEASDDFETTTSDTASFKTPKFVSVDELQIPEVYSLSQNYPNPFNPTTTFKFGLPTLSTVRLTIYDILGREVVTLVNEEIPAGYHEVIWNGRNGHNQTVSSG